MSLWKAGITPSTSIIFGYPQETLETITATLDLCEQCNIFPSVGSLLPLPGTPIYDWAVREGHIADEWEYLMRSGHSGDRQDFRINLTAIPTDEFVGHVESSLSALANRMGLQFDNPLKTTQYQKSKKSMPVLESAVDIDTE